MSFEDEVEFLKLEQEKRTELRAEYWEQQYNQLFKDYIKTLEELSVKRYEQIYLVEILIEARKIHNDRLTYLIEQYDKVMK